MDCAIDTIYTSSRKPKPEFKQQMIKEFWRKKKEEIKAIEDFNNHAIPMRRLRKVITVKKAKIMMRFDTPSFLTKACEIFVQELSFRAWMCANSHQRKIILDSDITEAIASMESCGFLNGVLRIHTNQDKHNSDPFLMPTKKHHHRLVNKPSKSHLLPSNLYLKPQSIPQSEGHFPHDNISSPLSPTDVCQMPLNLPCLLPEEAYLLLPTKITVEPIAPMICMAKGAAFLRNNSNSGIATFGVTTPLQVPPEPKPNITNTCCMDTIVSASSFCVGYANTSSIGVEDGGVVFHCPHIPTSSLQFSATSPVADTSDPTAISIIKLNHIQSEVKHIENVIDVRGTTNATYGIDPEATISVNNDQHQHGNLIAKVIPTINVSGDDKNINWDEVDMANDSLLIEFWQNVMMNEDPTPSLAATSTANLIVFPYDVPELKGFGYEILDGIGSRASASTSRRLS